MSYVPPKDSPRASAPMVHAANAVFALNEVRTRRGDFAAAGVLWGRVVRVGAVVAVGSARASARVLEVGVLVGGPSGPGAFRTVKVWNEAADAFALYLVRDFYGLLVGEWQAAVGKDGRLRRALRPHQCRRGRTLPGRDRGEGRDDRRAAPSRRGRRGGARRLAGAGCTIASQRRGSAARVGGCPARPWGRWRLLAAAQGEACRRVAAIPPGGCRTWR